MPVKLNGSTSGYVELTAPAVAGTTTLTLPATTGTLSLSTATNTFTASQIIEVTDNTNAALRITQLGTGDALRVEDSANPDSTPTVIKAGGEVGIGTASPEVKLHVAGNIMARSGTDGYNMLVIGGPTISGYMGAYNASGVRQGYFGYFQGTNLDVAWSDSTQALTFGTNATERLRIDGSNGTLTSQPTYDNTAAGSNVVVTSAGLIRRTSSSIKYKKDVEDLDPTIADNAIANLRPVWYRTKNAEGDDKAEWSHIGLIAEEVDQVEKRLVRYRTVNVTMDENGQRVETPLETPEPEDVDYARLSVILLDKVKRQDAVIASLEARLLALESA